MAAKLLAGPILRRTTKNRVCVWLATDQPMMARLTVMDAAGRPLGQSELEDLGEQCAQLGRNLCVYLLQARRGRIPPFRIDQGSAPGEFSADELLYYRLDEVDADGNATAMDLADLAYGDLPHPSFFIPAKLKHILHGSCRKPHGGFNPDRQKPMPDALSHGDALLERSHADLEQRPALLCLGGDQIYADDVAISLLAMLSRQGVALTGAQECLPLDDCAAIEEGAVHRTPLNPADLPLHGRRQALKEHHSGFSSGESENHLFTFGEFAAMYLYAYGNVPGWQPAWKWAELEKALKEKGAADTSAANAAWKKQEPPLRAYHKTLPKVRKLLANVPTYMIFDDHDVTDDWNITGAWYDGVRASPLGNRIVSNALAAYWAFQGWGNDPDTTTKDLILSITQRLNDDQDDCEIAGRYDLHTWKSRGWGFSVPTQPPIIAMDSRTQRQYENKYYPPLLLDRYALDWLRVEWAKLKTGQDIDRETCPIIIAATPVMGFSTIEWLQQFLLWLIGLAESWKPIQMAEKLAGIEGILTGWMVNKLDAESWAANKEGFAGLLDCIRRRMGIRRCVFLSGDVHYAFTADAGYACQSRKWFAARPVDYDYRLHCYQLTSSALSNQPDTKQSRFLEKAAQHGTGKETHRNWALQPSQRWEADVQLLTAEGTKLRVTAECNLGLVEFAKGFPVTHTLLTGNGDLVYRLPAPATE